ncbi:MAG: shikimate kinase [Candidatus Bathyarchaeota archaeon]|nr:shikimate kinase [Candidatus Bathyarchaeota archaeon]
MSGVGKSRVGLLLSKRLGYRFIDIDRIIKQDTNQRLQDLIDCLGEKKFLELEENAILGIGAVCDSVISSGGSSIYSPRAMGFLKGISRVVFLDASLEEIKRRRVNFSIRGVVGLREKGLDGLFLERQPLYRRYADVTIDVTGLSDKVAVDRIIEQLL